ncbi:GAF domain-containing sensor histidine kinase [Mangrovibacillus cuniculi]|nr:GAF domain-containing sensor histidine kinase [Mangrovibacillus cuniculi]
MKRTTMSNEQWQVLKDIAERLNGETELQPMLQGVLQQLLPLTGLTTGWIFLIDERGKHTLTASVNLPPALEKTGCDALKRGGCWCVDRFKNGTLHKATNLIHCKRIEEAIQDNECEVDDIVDHATVPLQAGGERFGILNVASPGKTDLSKEELALLESVALQIGSAIKRVQLTAQEKEVALVAERNRLARDLHDSVNQLLFSMNLTAKAGSMMQDVEQSKDAFGTIQHLAQEAIHEMRSLIWQLRPKGLEQGIVQAITTYADLISLPVKVKQDGVADIPSPIEERLWRISQEALNNAKKHADADKVWITIQKERDSVTFTIEDNGIGFDMSALDSLPTVGLSGMKERIEEAGGSFELESAIGRGTTIQATIPF